MTYENYIKARLVSYAVKEAYRFGGWDAMCAVAQVLANRVNEGWGEWNAVIDTADNYIGTIAEPPKLDPKDMTFRRMLSMIDDIYHGTADDTNVNVTDDQGTKIALYYADLNNIDREWFRENILSDLKAHPGTGTVGQLSFFA